MHSDWSAKPLHHFLTSHARPATKRSYSSLPTQFDMIEVLSSWPWATYTNAILCVSRLEEMKNHTYYSDTEQFLSRATHFSHLKPPSLFPALFISNKYSLRFPPLSFFSAPSAGYKFSRVFDRLPRLRTVTCFPALSLVLNSDWLTPLLARPVWILILVISQV